MTANVSFYNLIAILALHVKCHSLQERNVPGNVLIVDRVSSDMVAQKK